MNIIGYSVVNDYPNHQPPENFSYYHLFSVYYCIFLVPVFWRSVCSILDAVGLPDLRQHIHFMWAQNEICTH